MKQLLASLPGARGERPACQAPEPQCLQLWGPRGERPTSVVPPALKVSVLGERGLRVCGSLRASSSGKHGRGWDH